MNERHHLAGTCRACAAAAALYGHYLVLPGWLTGPEICQLEDGGCQVLFRRPRARLLGVPNAALGVLLYVLLATGLVLGWPWLLLFVMTWPALAMSAFLGYSLISNRRQCRICWAGHVANACCSWRLGIRGAALKTGSPVFQRSFSHTTRASAARRLPRRRRAQGPPGTRPLPCSTLPNGGTPTT